MLGLKLFLLLWCAPKETVVQTVELPVISDGMTVISLYCEIVIECATIHILNILLTLRLS